MSIKNALFLSALACLAPIASATDILVDSSCVLGTCPPPSGTSDAIQTGGSSSGSGSTTATVNGDTYSVDWNFNDSYLGGITSVIVQPTVTFVSGPSSGTDNLTFVLFQSFFNSSPGTWDGSYTETVPLTLSAAGTSANAQLCLISVTAQCLPSTPVENGPGSFLDQNTSNLSGLTGDNLVYQYQFNFTFDADTSPDTSITSTASSAAPEPVETLPLGLALIGFAGYKLSRRRKTNLS